MFHLEQATTTEGELKPLAELEDLFHAICGKLRGLMADLETRLKNAFLNPYDRICTVTNGKDGMTNAAASDLLADLQMRYEMLVGNDIYPVLEHAVKDKKAQKIIHDRVVARGVDPTERITYLKACAEEAQDIQSNVVAGLEDFRDAPVSMLFTMLAERQFMKDQKAASEKRRQDIELAAADLETHTFKKPKQKTPTTRILRDEELIPYRNAIYQFLAEKEDTTEDDGWTDSCSIDADAMDIESATDGDDEGSECSGDEAFTHSPVDFMDFDTGCQMTGAGAENVDDPKLQARMAALKISELNTPSVDQFFGLGSDCASTVESMIESMIEDQTTRGVSSQMEYGLLPNLVYRPKSMIQNDQASVFGAPVQSPFAPVAESLSPKQCHVDTSMAGTGSQTFNQGVIMEIDKIHDNGVEVQNWGAYPNANSSGVASTNELPSRRVSKAQTNSMASSTWDQYKSRLSAAQSMGSYNQSILYQPRTGSQYSQASIPNPWTPWETYPAVHPSSKAQQENIPFSAGMVGQDQNNPVRGSDSQLAELGPLLAWSYHIENAENKSPNSPRGARRDQPSAKDRLRKIWMTKVRRDPYSPTLDGWE